MFNQILEFLDGRKAKILAIAGLIISYLVTAAYLEATLGTLILSVLNVIAGGAAMITDRKLGGRKRNFNV